MAVWDKQANDLFLGALEIPAAQRPAWLAKACGGDAELRRAVEGLLAAHITAGSMLENPAGLAATIDGKRAAVSPPAVERPGTIIGNFKLLQLIGEGGFGSVFMAEQEKPVRRRVALKIIKLGMDTKQVIARFEAERQALAMMDHPNIAKILDAGATASGRPYFVMELVKGIPITQYCDENKLPTKARLELFVAVCNALQHAHQKGVIHRDIKPSNILVTLHDGTPVPKLIDFGIAKATQSRLTEMTLFTEFRQMIGTPAYMSPEQAEMSGLDVDTRSDIYSLGVLLYELLTGTTPFDPRELCSQAYAEMQRIIREVDPPRPSTRLSTMGKTITTVAANRAADPRKLSQLVRGELDWIVMRSLEKDRTRRYESAGELARDVQRHLNDEPVAACPPSAIYKTIKFVRRNRAMVTTLAAIILVAFAVTAIYIRGIRAEQRKTELALIEARIQREEAQKQKGNADRQRDEARKQEKIAISIGDFLSNMLSSADPNKLLGDKVTVVQAIAEATKQLDNPGPGIDPLIEASLRDKIGLTLYALGRYEQAEPSLRKALEIRRRMSQQNAEIATTLHNLGAVLEAQYRQDEAMALLNESLEICRRVLPADDPEIATNLIAIGAILLHQNRPVQAEPLLVEALRINRKTCKAGDPRIAVALNALGALREQQNNLSEAEPLIREAMNIDLKALPSGHPQIAGDLRVMGILLLAQHKNDQAEKMFTESLDIRRRTLPAGHPLIADTLDSLAVALIRRDKFDEAETMLRDAIEIDRNALPLDHPSLARDLLNLGAILELTKPAESEHVYREALAIRRRILPAGHPDVAQAMQSLAGFLTSQQQNHDTQAEIEKLLREALVIDQATLPEDHPQTAYCLQSLALFTANAGKLDEAEPLYEQALSIQKATLPEDDPDISLTLENMASMRNRQKQPKEAETLLREVLRINRKAFSPGHARIAITQTHLANLLTRESQFKEADALFTEALPVLRKTAKLGFGDVHNAIAGYTLMLSRAHRSPAESEKSLRELLEVHRGAVSPSPVRISMDLMTLGAVLANMGRNKEAEPFLREALAVAKTVPKEQTWAKIATRTLAMFLARTGRAEESRALLANYEWPAPTTREYRDPLWAPVFVPQ